tara:strand:- start:544 stop:750 length:207 start_codon:yes stop_codon:yes gene_type:complete
MKKSKNKINEEVLLEDIDKILDYVNNLSNLDIENTDLDKMDDEIKGLDKNIRKKYKEYLPKEDLDSKE